MGYIQPMAPARHTSGRPAHLRRAEDIAGLIRARREALGLSQQALADRLTVSRKWVNEIEQGNSKAKLELVLRALNELGIELYGRLPSDKDQYHRSASVDGIDIDSIADAGLTTRRKR
jgi:HTH-type transcriptional regulator / antitoxin HipB